MTAISSGAAFHPAWEVALTLIAPASRTRTLTAKRPLPLSPVATGLVTLRSVLRPRRTVTCTVSPSTNRETEPRTSRAWPVRATRRSPTRWAPVIPSAAVPGGGCWSGGGAAGTVSGGGAAGTVSAGGAGGAASSGSAAAALGAASSAAATRAERRCIEDPTGSLWGRHARSGRPAAERPDQREGDCDGDDDGHRDLPRPALGDPEGQRVVGRVQGDARQERAGVLVEQAQHHAEGHQGRDERRLGGDEVDGPEDAAGDQRGRPDALPVAQRGEHVPAEEELLGDRRQHADQDRHGDQRRGGLVGAQLGGQVVLGRLVVEGQLEEDSPGRSEQEEADVGERRT